MGMAASQARYLTLSARKTNVEYEGQQINQARTSLANQSANLFNQMLSMEVPTPPSTTDFTTVQYSYSDGVNTEVLSNYYQLGTADSDYNYVVTTYHNEKVYTGSRKKLNDPQIQATTKHDYSYDPTSIDNNTTRTVKSATHDGEAPDDTFVITTTDGATKVFRPVTSADEERVQAINYGNNVFKTATVDLTKPEVINEFQPVRSVKIDEIGGTTGSQAAFGRGLGVDSKDIAQGDITPGNWSVATDADKDLIAKLFGVDKDSINPADYSVSTTVPKEVYKGTVDNPPTHDLIDVRNEGTISDSDKDAIKFLYGLDSDPEVGAYYKDANGNYITQEGYITLDTKAAETRSIGAVSDEDKAAIAKIYGVVNPQPGDYYKTEDGAFITKAEYTAAAADTEAKYNEGAGIKPSGSTQVYYTDGTSYVTRSELENAEKGQDIKYLTVSDDPTFSNYTAVGNCNLSELTEKDMTDEDINAEISQIIKDMQAEGGDPVSAANLAACFDAEGNYKGGIYQFTMNGTKYFTTKNDLDLSLSRPLVENGIDVQQDKLKYYNASYIETKVEETQKALLETDGKGRFSSVKLENDSIKYTLNTETVTDEDAYNDAMNQYYYKNAEYEKALADINAKTEVIQAQDRTLELRLEQLNTEQSALQNEMEAVKKVVDKHVELGFKTFGG